MNNHAFLFPQELKNRHAIWTLQSSSVHLIHNFSYRFSDTMNNSEKKLCK